MEFKFQGLLHGGRILAAVEKYQIAKDEWLDLSTGLNPNAWPVSEIPLHVWQSLPEDNDGLQTAACNFYGCDACLPVSGLQAAIQMLPTLRSYSKVGVVSPTYAEHAHNWEQAGHDVFKLNFEDVEKYINTLDVLVVINPNNPTGKIIAIEQLLEWQRCLSKRKGWLVVDEAFMDTTPENSLIASGIKPGLIILRSMGKFFGIAGIRCGFVIAENNLLQKLAEKIGPWSLSGATRYIAKQALADKIWHIKTRKYLDKSATRLQKTLSQSGLESHGGTSLFQWLAHKKAKEIYEACAEKGILIRFFEKEVGTSLPSIRFGLPVNEQQWQKLSNVVLGLSTLIETT